MCWWYNLGGGLGELVVGLRVVIWVEGLFLFVCLVCSLLVMLCVMLIGLVIRLVGFGL